MIDNSSKVTESDWREIICLLLTMSN
jgi:hypothetical protein